MKTFKYTLFALSLVVGIYAVCFAMVFIGWWFVFISAPLLMYYAIYLRDPIFGADTFKNERLDPWWVIRIGEGGHCILRAESEVDARRRWIANFMEDEWDVQHLRIEGPFKLRPVLLDDNV